MVLLRPPPCNYLTTTGAGRRLEAMIANRRAGCRPCGLARLKTAGLLKYENQGSFLRSASVSLRPDVFCGVAGAGVEVRLAQSRGPVPARLRGHGVRPVEPGPACAASTSMASKGRRHITCARRGRSRRDPPAPPPALRSAASSGRPCTLTCAWWTRAISPSPIARRTSTAWARRTKSRCAGSSASRCSSSARR